MSSRAKLIVVLALTTLWLPLFVGVAEAAPVQLSGRVSDSANSPIGNATVDVLTPSTSNVVATATTNSSGNYALDVESGTYDIRVTPTSGSGFQPSTSPGRQLAANTTLDFVLVSASAIRLTGRVTDGLGNGAAGQVVVLRPASGGQQLERTTDAAGAYTFEVAAGNYSLLVTGSLATGPRAYIFQTTGFPVALTQDTTIDVPLPLRRVTVQVRDSAGNPVPNVQITTTRPSNNSLVLNGWAANGSSDGGATTGSAGDAMLWLFPTAGGSYTITAIPPAGGPFAATTVAGVTFAGDATVPVTLASSLTLTGRVTDGLGNGAAGQVVVLRPASGGQQLERTTDGNGSYSFQAAAGSYSLLVTGSTGAGPRAYIYQTTGFPVALTQSTTIDIPLPVKRLSVRVQDVAGGAIANVRLSTTRPSTNGLVLNGWAAGGSSDGEATSNSAGDAVLWLFPTDPAVGGSYTITATPPAGGPFAAFNLTGVTFSADESVVIVLQFIHAPPVTTASFNPAAVNGVHPGPVTVTLSATAASGFTITSTKYTVDGGPEQTYSAPFTITQEGMHTIRFWSVDNSGVFEAPKTQSLQIASLRITTPTPLTEGSTGAAYSASLAAMGGTSPYTWSLAAGSALPAGLSLNASTGAITGTPTATGTTTFTARVSDSSSPSQTATKEFSVTIVQGNRPPTASAGGPYSVVAGQSVMLTGAGSDPDGDTLAYTWDLDDNGSFETAGQNPSFSAAGLTGGTNRTVRLRVCDNRGACAEASATVNVLSAITITTGSPLPSGTVGAPYSQTFMASGGTPPYTWDIVPGGTLPPGLTLSASGVLSGTPTTAGSFAFTVRVTDSSTVTATKQFTFAPPPPSGTAGTPYSTPVTITDPAPGGGTQTCSGGYRVVAGALPPGVTLNEMTGTLSGTPTNGGTYSVTIGCTVPSGQTATKDFTITINNPAPALTGLDPSTKVAGGAGFTLTATGTGFVSGSVVRWNSAARPTTYVSATQLRAEIPAADIAAAGSASVTVVNATPGGGTSNALPFAITSANQPPVANAGGPYSVPEGDSVMLNGSGTDPDGGTLAYTWDLNNDGTFETTGATATFSAAGRDGLGSQTVVLKVCDPMSVCATAMVTVTITNVAPSATFSAPASAPGNAAFMISLAMSTDPSSADTAAGFTYAFDCGTGMGYGAFASASNQSCPSATAGMRAVKGKVRDKDGGEREYTATVTLTPVSGQPVRPVLECVIQRGPSDFVARFGYLNGNTDPVTIAIGSTNRFTPTPQDRGQPSTFQPGRIVGAFEVPFNGSNLVWTLTGRTSTASSNSTRCSTAMNLPAGQGLVAHPAFVRAVAPGRVRGLATSREAGLAS